MPPSEQGDNFLLGFLDALKTGFSHSYNTLQEDLGRIIEGDVDSRMLGRIWDVVGELPVAKMAGKGAEVAKGVWGPIRTPQQKKVAKAIFRADPEIAQAIQADPRTMNIRVPQEVPYKVGDIRRQFGGKISPWQSMLGDDPAMTNYGMYSNWNDPGKGGTIAVNPRVLKGMSPNMTKNPVRDVNSDLPSTALHEATHFLNTPDVYRMTDPQGAEFARALAPLLNKPGQMAVHDLLEKKKGALAADEVLAYLSETALREGGIAKEVNERLKPRPTAWGIGTSRDDPLPFDPNLSRMMDKIMGVPTPADYRPQPGKPPSLMDEINHYIRTVFGG